MGRLRAALGIRLTDIFATVVVALVVELDVRFGGGAGSHQLNALAYTLGTVLALPVLLRRKWPLPVLIVCSVLLLVYYISGFRRNISPAPLLSLPLYDAALAGYLVISIVIPAFFMSVGLFVVGAATHSGLASLADEFLPSIVVLVLAIMLGETVRSRRALAAETAERLRHANEEREAETARRLAEERLRIARELHDTVAHSMATITVQAGSALHRLDDPDAGVRAALLAIRDTSKAALAEMRITLGQLRGADGQVDARELRGAGLDRLPALSDAVRAAGAPVTVTIEGDQVPLAPGADHAAYRILQESLTNVLRHAGPDASAAVRLTYLPGELSIEITDDGAGGPAPPGPLATAAVPAQPGLPAETAGNGHLVPGKGVRTIAPTATVSATTVSAFPGHGLTGMAERVAAVGGQLVARPRAGGGFEVLARLPVGQPPS